MYNNRNNNFNHGPYIAKNMLIKKAEISTEQPPIVEIPDGAETGYICISVFTALGALPVENAIVTVYNILDNGEEHLHAKLLTDSSGRVPDIELPVLHDPLNPLVSPNYYFTTYNLRTQADNFYTVNVLGIRIFPGIKTNYKIDLIPLMADEKGKIPEQTFIIPPSTIDRSNE
ncbi:MAG: hypothetical protein ACERLG_00360 [Sedimentibacter sp.]